VTNLPEKSTGASGGNLPARLTNRDFELVIRRAAELQARDAEGSDGDGIDEVEVLRIGRELGLSTQHLHRALAEVQGSGPPEAGAMTWMFGPSAISVGRTVRGDAAQVAKVLESYLVGREYLSVLRRLPDRVLYTRAAGATAAVGRAMSKAFNRRPPLVISNLETTVRRIEDDFAYVGLTTTLSGQRVGTAITSLGGGLWGGGALAAFLGIAVAPVAALAGIPILLGAAYGGHVYYEGVVERIQTQLESLLDRLEHGELIPQPQPGFMGMGKPNR
jgi:hypothetical protein